jgi:hypothetical protein
MMAQPRGEEGLVDVVALNVVRRTAAYSCRLLLFDGGTLTARSVVITAGVTCRRLGVPGAGRSAESSGVSRRRVGVPRREGRAEIIPDGGAAGAGSPARRLGPPGPLLPGHWRVPAAGPGAARGRPMA